jgi:hypothetical protein
MNILIKYPSKGRPDLFKQTSKKFIDKLSGKHNVKFLFSLDIDDRTMNNGEMIEFMKSLPIRKKINFRNNKSKVDAINADLDDEEFDILIYIQDDLTPTYDGYDDLIVSQFEKSEYGLDCMLHFQTPRWSDSLDIYCVLGKKYYDRFGYVYHPSYKSLFCDDEYTEVSKILKRNVFIRGIDPFNHNHGLIQGDEVEMKNRSHGDHDWALLQKRRENNFDIILDSNY